MRFSTILTLAQVAYIGMCTPTKPEPIPNITLNYLEAYQMSPEEQAYVEKDWAIKEPQIRKFVTEWYKQKGTLTDKKVKRWLEREKEHHKNDWIDIFQTRKRNERRIVEVPLILETQGAFQKFYFPNQLETHWNDRYFLAEIDTGSCNLLLPHAGCQTCDSPKKYSSLKSITAMRGLIQKTSIRKFKTFLSQKLDSIQIADTVVFGEDHKNDQVWMTIEMAIKSHDQVTWEGVLGLCPQNSQNGEQDYTVNETIHEDAREEYRSTLPYEIGRMAKLKGQRYTNVFSINMDTKNPENSKIVYGGILNEFSNKPIVYFKNYEKVWSTLLLPKGHYKSDKWTTVIDKVKFGDIEIEAPQKKSFMSYYKKSKPLVRKVLFDTGCTLHQAPKPFVEKIIELTGFEVIHREESVIAKCTKEQYDSLPDLTFHVGKKTITLHKHLWAYFEPKLSLCGIAISTLPSDFSFQDSFILGYNFFKQYFTVFDNENNRIGIYDKGPQK